MSRTDLIADAFTMIRNAIMAKKENLDVPASNLLIAILGILKKEEYIDDFKVIKDVRQDKLRIYLKYVSGRPAIRAIKRVTRPGLRKYVRADKIPSVIRGKGIAILSTSKGVVTGFEAKNLGVGGEVMGYVW